VAVLPHDWISLPAESDTPRGLRRISDGRTRGRRPEALGQLDVLPAADFARQGAWSFFDSWLEATSPRLRVGSHSTGPQEHRTACQESDSDDRQSQAHPVVRRCQEWASWDELIAYATRVDARQGNRGDDTGSRDDEGEGEQYSSFHPSKDRARRTGQ
jgi:hypothetical protein